MASLQVADAPEDIIGDTGSSVHLVGRDLIHGYQRPYIRSGVTKRKFTTANGKIKADSLVHLKSDNLPGTFEATVLDKCPRALSIGELCAGDDQWSFVWLNLIRTTRFSSSPLAKLSSSTCSIMFLMCLANAELRIYRLSLVNTWKE